jgi:hypothetical protein
MIIHNTKKCLYRIFQISRNYTEGATLRRKIYVILMLQERRISTQENFPQKENFAKCDWPTQIFRRKKILKLNILNF